MESGPEKKEVTEGSFGIRMAEKQHCEILRNHTTQRGERFLTGRTWVEAKLALDP